MIPDHGFLHQRLYRPTPKYPDLTYHRNPPTFCKLIGTSARRSIKSLATPTVIADGCPSLTLNLKAKEGQEIARRLIEEADVLVEN